MERWEIGGFKRLKIGGVGKPYHTSAGFRNKLSKCKDMTNKIIDSLNGQLKISDLLIVSKKTVPNDLFRCFKPNDIEVRDVKTGYIHYTIRDINLKNYYFYFSLCFFGDKLARLTFGFKDQPGMLSWDDWSEAKEIQRKVEYDHWLNDEIGTLRTFPWGTIVTFFDGKGGGSGIVLRYN
ncbi:MAG TPA: hypothetical protein VGI43_03525 [Mucilaginibacter sp.]